jgi:hypothetical protein
MKRQMERRAMKATIIWTGALLLASVSPVTAEDGEHLAMARVRLSTEAAAARGCTRVGTVSDDRVKDLRKKIVREGGDTAILTFSTDNMSTILAEVYKCPPRTTAVPKATPAPPVSSPTSKPASK